MSAKLILLAVLCLAASHALAFTSTSLSCQTSFVESIPLHLQLKTVGVPTGDAWYHLFQRANSSIDVASFYWSLTGGDKILGGDSGEKVFESLVDAGKRGVQIRIVQSKPEDAKGYNETDLLVQSKLAEVRTLDMSKYYSSGILHTKFIIVDNTEVYVGSANMDWRSLTQVKELGLLYHNCRTVASDLSTVFEVYWQLSQLDKLPSSWPRDLATPYNLTNPLKIKLNNESGSMFIGASPKGLLTSGRTLGIDGLLSVINNAQSNISIQVMDYSASFLYTKEKEYWPLIDDALRRAVWEREVHLRFMSGNWTHTRKSQYAFLQSLKDLCSEPRSCRGSIEISAFNVPHDPHGDAPFSRVNHAKFMVTEQELYVGTSNWSGDYFETTCGVGVVCNHETLVALGQEVFDRDWNSPFNKVLA